jgi:glycosyltransferase involved in cell wall biosynthesis
MSEQRAYPHRLGAVIMMKNEAETILLTIRSVIGTVDCVVCYDTGSTDNTIELVQTCCRQHKLPFYLTTGTFVDFSTSRNVLVEFAEQYCEFQLHLDSADVLLGGANLKMFVQSYRPKPNQPNRSATAFMIFQQWYMGGTSIRFRNLRLMMSGYGYRYRCRVHEMLMKPNFIGEVDTMAIDTKFDESPEATNNPNGTAPMTGFVVFQNRMLDNTKTLKRFQRDAVMLYDDWLSDPEETRTLFYLAQTFDHMGDPQRGYLWYQKRVDPVRELKGFSEESLHAHMRLGKLAQRIGMEDEIAERHYWNAIEFSMKHFNGRVLLEPVMLLVKILDSRKEFAQAFQLLKGIMDEPYPVHMNLFVDATAYKYLRYHWMGRVGWYVGQYIYGGWYAIVAYRANQNEADHQNIKVYLSASSAPIKSKPNWEDEAVLNKLIRSCPSIQAYERCWLIGDMNWPDVDIKPPVVDTSVTTPSVGQPSLESESKVALTAKQKLQAKREQQRLMRKAK